MVRAASPAAVMIHTIIFLNLQAEQASKNEGLSCDVDENTEPVFHRLRRSHDVAENKRPALIPAILHKNKAVNVKIG